MRHRSRTVPRARILLFAVLSPALVLTASGVAAESATPIEVHMLGPSAARVRLAVGSTFPCDSGENQRIVDGKFTPGQVLRASAAARCVCFQQTYEPFSDSDWSAPTMVCRPQICTNFGRKRCVPAPDPTIRLQISSKRF